MSHTPQFIYVSVTSYIPFGINKILISYYYLHVSKVLFTCK